MLAAPTAPEALTPALPAVLAPAAGTAPGRKDTILLADWAASVAKSAASVAKSAASAAVSTAASISCLEPFALDRSTAVCVCAAASAVSLAVVLVPRAARLVLVVTCGLVASLAAWAASLAASAATLALSTAVSAAVSAAASRVFFGRPAGVCSEIRRRLGQRLGRRSGRFGQLGQLGWPYWRLRYPVTVSTGWAMWRPLCGHRLSVNGCQSEDRVQKSVRRTISG